ncbi:DUF3800 domain-containing protein [Streptomyces microflavus]|nr:DUF3800 domain-containing protein [Streptomyces sp. BE282]
MDHHRSLPSCSARSITPPPQGRVSVTPYLPPKRLLSDSVYYLDDSGNRDISLFGFFRVPWVEGPSVADAQWSAFLEKLKFNPDFSYTPGYPLHAVDLLGGRGRLLHPEGGPPPGLQRKREVAGIVLQGLETLAQVPELTVGSVYRRGATREALYADLVEMINNWHAEAGSSCRFVVDGNGTERALRDAHRRLPSDRRHVLGDPELFPARGTPLLQAADFVAHAAYQFLVRYPARAFMWDWYPRVFPESSLPIDLGRLH